RRRLAAAPSPRPAHPRGAGHDGAEPSQPCADARRAPCRLLSLQDAALDGPQRALAAPGESMNAETIDVAALRRVLMDQPEPWTTRAVALAVSIAFLAAVLNLVRRGRLREEY